MIKAITPVVVLAVSVIFKVKTASAKLFGIVCIISLGVGIASYGEIDFDLLGFSVQVRPRQGSISMVICGLR